MDNEVVENMIDDATKGCELPEEVADFVKENVGNPEYSDMTAPISGTLNEATGANTTSEDLVPMAEATGVPPEMIEPITSTSVSKFADVPVADDRGYTPEDIMSILESIENVNESFELTRKMSNAKEQLQAICNMIGLGRLDQDYINNKLRECRYTENEVSAIMMDEKKLNETFFTKPDGKVIKIKNINNYTDHQIKQELIGHVYAFYILEKEIEQQAKDVRMETNKVTSAGVDVLTDNIANTFTDVLFTEREQLKAKEDTLENRLALKKNEMRQAAFTFNFMLDLIHEHPKVVENTVWDYKHETRVRAVGERYGEQRGITKTGSALYAVISDDPNESLEAKFLNPTQYEKGYENLFVFALIRYFGHLKWKSTANPKTNKPNDNFAKDQHNAVCLLLRALMQGRMRTDVRDTFVANIVDVWAEFLPYVRCDNK